MARGRLIAGAVVAFALLAPAGTQAATVSVGPPSAFSAAAHYEAAPGEANGVTLTFEEYGGPLVVRDEGAKITAGDGCSSVDAHTVRCAGAPLPEGPPTSHLFITTVVADLGDRDDRLTTEDRSGDSVTVDGGAGDDTIAGDEGSDTLDGGGGRDELHGGGGEDVITDGDSSGAPDADILDGGLDDFDVISYEGRSSGVVIDLQSGRSGKGGTEDRVSGFENAVGGAGGDRIIGTDAFNTLTGNAGDDVIEGLAGGDSIRAGTGHDRVSGGDGHDLLVPGPQTDAVRCGAGRDTVSRPDGGELLGRRCELAGLGYDEDAFTLAAQPRSVGRRSAVFQLGCPHSGESEPSCAGVLELRERSGRVLARGPISLDGDAPPQPVTVRFTRRGRKLVARRGGVLARLSYRVSTGPGEGGRVVGWTLRLRR